MLMFMKDGLIVSWNFIIFHESLKNAVFQQQLIQGFLILQPFWLQTNVSKCYGKSCAVFSLYVCIHVSDTLCIYACVWHFMYLCMCMTLYVCIHVYDTSKRRSGLLTVNVSVYKVVGVSGNKAYKIVWRYHKHHILTLF